MDSESLVPSRLMRTSRSLLCLRLAHVESSGVITTYNDSDLRPLQDISTPIRHGSDHCNLLRHFRMFAYKEDVQDQESIIREALLFPPLCYASINLIAVKPQLINHSSFPLTLNKACPTLTLPPSCTQNSTLLLGASNTKITVLPRLKPPISSPACNAWPRSSVDELVYVASAYDPSGFWRMWLFVRRSLSKLMWIEPTLVAPTGVMLKKP